MGKREMIRYFDALAPEWDAHLRRNEESISRILDWAQITKNASVLDVGCGTGVLIQDYLRRGAGRVTGIDISPAMIARAAQKNRDERVRLIAADAESYVFEERFDCCVVYNAFPHFLEPEKLLCALSAALKDGGRLIVAHGMGREAVNAHHGGMEAGLCIDLPEAQTLKALFAPRFEVDLCVSQRDVYAVSGLKK